MLPQVSNPSKQRPNCRLLLQWSVRQKSIAPLLLYVLISLALLWPYRFSAVRWTGDMKTVLALVIEARRALAEGQFPIRVALDLQNGTRYPQFQYYGNLPYTAAGAACALFRDDPYLGWKVVTLFSLIAGGWFMRRLAYALVHNDPAATMAGAVFLSAPYLLTDLYARVAFTELIAINLLPAAFYLSIRCFRSPRWRYIVASAVAWAMIALSHNITYLYGLLFLALLLLSQFTRTRGPRRIARLALAGVLHAALVIWYVAPQLATVDLTEIGSVFTPQYYAGLAPLRVLLSPVLLNTPRGEETPNLGLQVGWPILSLVLTAIIAVGMRRVRKPMVVRLLFLWLLAFFVAWSPINFWHAVPQTFWFIQFPYRMLMFIVLFGAILSAFSIKALFPRRLPAWFVVAMLGALGLAMSSFYPHGRVPLYADLTAQLKVDPNLWRLKEFVPKAEALTVRDQEGGRPGYAGFPPRVLPRGWQAVSLGPAQLQQGRVTRCDFVAHAPTLLVLPILDYPGLLDVRIDQKRITYGNAGRYVALQLPPGQHQITLRFSGFEWANVSSVLGWAVVVLAMLAGIIKGFQRLRTGLSAPYHGARPDALRSAPGITGGMILAGFAAMMICVIVPTSDPVRRLFRTGPELTVSADHSTWDGLPEYAFDDLPQTAWMAGTGQPTHLTVLFSQSAKLNGIEFDPRLVSLYEGWRHIRITLFDRERAVFEKSFNFPHAGTDRQQFIEFASIQANRVEFEFSDPVDRRNDGSQIPASELSPGYSEIRFLWDR